MSERRLAIVVTTGAGGGDLERAFELARAARSSGIQVGLFFMHRAVAALPDRRGETEALAELGCDLTCCAESARALDLSEERVGMILGSQDDHAALVHRADRLVSFS